MTAQHVESGKQWTRRGRLALSKGEGEGEGFIWLSGVCEQRTPHLSPLPCLRGEATRTARRLLCNHMRLPCDGVAAFFTNRIPSRTPLEREPYRR
jgi:hypothetical protein